MEGAVDTEVCPDEIMSIMDECITVLANDTDEFTNLESAGKITLEWKSFLRDKENSIKQSINALASDCEEERKKAHAEAAAGVEASVEALSREIQGVEQHKQQVAAQVEQCKQLHTKCHADIKQLGSQGQQVKASVSQDLPELRHTANLFHHISNIRWQYDGSPEEVKGYVCNKGKVRTFALNTKQNSKSFIVNYLWDMMEPDW